MKIEKLAGTDQRLYVLVAPLVMRPSVLRQNNNYPFKTTEHHVWFVALDADQVVGFIPVELKDKTATINNYYVVGDDRRVLKAILQELILSLAQEYKLYAVAHTRHVPVFQGNDFEVIRTWKLYVKMEYRRK
jgi:hypothetical protein